MWLSLQILFVHFLALLSYFILYHCSDVVTICNFFMKARPNTSWDREIKGGPTLFSDFYTYTKLHTNMHGCMYITGLMWTILVRWDHRMSMVSIVYRTVCPAFRARWNFSIIYVHGRHSMWVIDACVGSILTILRLMVLPLHIQTSKKFVHYSGITLLWTLLGEQKISW